MERNMLMLAVALMVTPVAAAASGSPHAQDVVEGHTVFAQLVPDGGSLAAVAGSVQCQVLWFNDQVLFRVPAGSTGMCGDSRFVYAYPAAAPDPRGNPTLHPTGRSWDFVDPNGAPWHVLEYNYKQLDLGFNQNLGVPNFIAQNTTVEEFNYTSWIVETGQPVRDPTILQDYNFVVLVDASKLTLRQSSDGVPDVRSPIDTHTGGTGGSTHPTQTADPTAPGHGYVTLSLGDTPPLWS